MVHALVAMVATRPLPYFLFVTAIAVILLQLLLLAEGAKRPCPAVCNLTTNSVPYPPTLASGQGNNVPLALSVTFTKIGKSVCDCKLQEINSGRAKLKAQVKRCECPVNDADSHCIYRQWQMWLVWYLAIRQFRVSGFSEQSLATHSVAFGSMLSKLRVQWRCTNCCCIICLKYMVGKDWSVATGCRW